MTSDDVMLALSNSGQTDELLRFIPMLLHMNIPIIGMSANPKSLLAKYSTVHLKVKVEKEACPLNNDFGRITYTDAVALLENHNDQFEYPVHWGSDLQTEHERFLTEQVFKKPVFVTDYPKEIKAFYMKLNPDGKTVAADSISFSFFFIEREISSIRSCFAESYSLRSRIGSSFTLLLL